MLRAIERLRFTAFGGGDDLSDRPSAKAAGAEGDRPEKAVVEFRPLPALDEFRDALRDNRRVAAVEHGHDISRAAFQKLGGVRGSFDAGSEIVHREDSSGENVCDAIIVSLLDRADVSKSKSGHFDRSAGGKASGAEWRNLLLFFARAKVVRSRAAFALRIVLPERQSERFLHSAPPTGPPSLRSK